MTSKDKMKKMREKSQERRMNSVEEFSDKIREKLGDKVKVVAAWGSVPKGEHGVESDIDTLVILDDTKLQKDVPKDAKQKIRKKVTDLAQETDERITIQYFPFLTEFWDSLRKGEPLAIEAVRNGQPVYDTGIFMPAKRLLERGKITGTQESVKKRLKLAAAGYKKAEKNMKSSIPHKLEQSMANAGQAPIMLMGKAPPGKENVPDTLRDMFVENEMLEEEYVELAEEIYEFGDVGEKNPKDVSGKQVDEHLEKTDKFLRRMHQLVSQIGSKKKVKGIVEDYKKFLKANLAALKSKGITPPKDKDDLPGAVEENLDVDEHHMEMFNRWEDLIQKIKDNDMENVDEKEIYELKNETQEFVKKVGKDIQKMKAENTDITPKIDPENVSGEKDIVPNLQEEAEKKAEKEDVEK